MAVSEKIKTIDDKIEESITQYNLDRKKLKFQLDLEIMLVNMSF